MGRGNNGIGHVWAANTSAGDAGRPNGVGPVWIENISAIGGGGGGGSFTGVSHDSNLSGDGLNSPLGMASNVFADNMSVNTMYSTSGVAADADTDSDEGYFYRTDYSDNTQGWRVAKYLSNEPTSFGMEVYQTIQGESESEFIHAGTYITTAGIGINDTLGSNAFIDYSQAAKLTYMPPVTLVATSAQATGSNILYVVTGSN